MTFRNALIVAFAVVFVVTTLTLGTDVASFVRDSAWQFIELVR